MDGAFELRQVERSVQQTEQVEHDPVDFESMLERELEHVLTRKPGRGRDEPLVGVALSGGGVRSATISLGFLRELMCAGVLPRLDYLSSVSGGGYASGYLFSAWRAFRGDAQKLFCEKARKELEAGGRYLATGDGWRSFFRGCRLVASVLSMAALNLLWMAVLVVAFGALVKVGSAVSGMNLAYWLQIGGIVALLVPLGRLAFLTLFRSVAAATSRGGVGVASPTQAASAFMGKAINWLEGSTLLVGLVVVCLLVIAPASYEFFESAFLGACAEFHVGWDVSPASVALCAWPVVGVLVSSEVIGLNAVFRNLIDSAYLRAGFRAAGRRWSGDLFLKDLGKDSALPYPLFNGGLYLLGKDAELENAADERYPAGKADPRRPYGPAAMDYFVYSPLFCGSAATCYANTSSHAYARTTVADAVAASAASVSPLMDGRGNALLAFLMMLFNLNLGVWLPNPQKPSRWPVPVLAFWPFVYWNLLFRRLNTSRRLVHVADGGFVDNLGTIELLRRRCRLVVVIDNTYDPKYEFGNLRNLVRRARDEEGIRIEFDCRVEDDLRPSFVTGLAARDYAIGKMTAIAPGDRFEGYLVYVKATVTSRMFQAGGTDVEKRAARYPTYHPCFPQESTADQFFDPLQWNAYFRLGRVLGASVLEALGERPRAALADGRREREPAAAPGGEPSRASWFGAVRDAYARFTPVPAPAAERR